MQNLIQWEQQSLIRLIDRKIKKICALLVSYNCRIAFTKWSNGLRVCICVCVSCDGACKHTFTCMCYGEFATGTIILAEKQNEHRNPFRKWPRYGAVDNCIICRFNWKYKTPCTHHYGRLWYTSWRLMHRGTSHTCRGICASFKYHSTFGKPDWIAFKQLIELVTKITSSSVAYCTFHWILLGSFFSPVVIFCIWQSQRCCRCFFPAFIFFSFSAPAVFQQFSPV